MGGSGSGRWFRLETAKDRVEDCSVLDIFKLAPTLRKYEQEREQHPNRPLYGSMTYGNGGAISFCLTSIDQVRLMYSIKSTGRELDYCIPLTRTYPHFGGYRLWFLCPRCSTRCGKLYLAPGQVYYVCRKCADLTYQSTREMSLAKAMKIQDLDDVESIEKMSTSQLLNWMKASIRVERQIAKRLR
jgi:hypothetical protein